MYLTHHQTPTGPRWALDGYVLPQSFNLGLLLELPADAIPAFLNALPAEDEATGDVLAPIEPTQEVWARRDLPAQYEHRAMRQSDDSLGHAADQQTL